MSVHIQLPALEHRWWSISTGSCLTTFLTALISLRATTIYLLICTWRTALQQHLGVDGRYQNVAVLLEGGLLWHRHTKTYSPTQMLHFWRWLCWEVAEVCTYFLHIVTFVCLIACFVNSLPKVTFRIALVYWKMISLREQKQNITGCR
jgi:hypothetical protein